MSKSLTILCIVVFVISSIVLAANAYMVDRDTTAWKARAESVSSPDQMLKYMQNVKSGLETWGMTSGYAALIFPTSENDMGQIYLAVNDHIKNLELAVKMDPTSNESQNMINRLQHSIGDLNIPSVHYWNVHQGLIWVIFWWVSLVAGIIAGAYWSINS